jgi:hypothetical protein
VFCKVAAMHSKESGLHLISCISLLEGQLDKSLKGTGTLGDALMAKSSMLQSRYWEMMKVESPNIGRLWRIASSHIGPNRSSGSI